MKLSTFENVFTGGEEMKAGEIMRKTIKFVWLKLGFGVAMTLIAALGMAVFGLIGGLFGGGGVVIMLCI